MADGLSEDDLLQLLQCFLEALGQKIITVEIQYLVSRMIDCFHSQGNSNDWFLRSGNLEAILREFIRTRECFFEDPSGFPSVFVRFSANADPSQGLRVHGDMAWNPPSMYFENLEPSVDEGCMFRLVPRFDEPTLDGTPIALPAEVEYHIGVDMPWLEWNHQLGVFEGNVPKLSEQFHYVSNELRINVTAIVIKSFPENVRLERTLRTVIRLNVVPPKRPEVSTARMGSCLSKFTRVNTFPLKIEAGSKPEFTEEPRQWKHLEKHPVGSHHCGIDCTQCHLPPGPARKDSLIRENRIMDGSDVAPLYDYAAHSRRLGTKKRVKQDSSPIRTPQNLSQKASHPVSLMDMDIESHDIAREIYLGSERKNRECAGGDGTGSPLAKSKIPATLPRSFRPVRREENRAPAVPLQSSPLNDDTKAIRHRICCSSSQRSVHRRPQTDKQRQLLEKLATATNSRCSSYSSDVGYAGGNYNGKEYRELQTLPGRITQQKRATAHGLNPRSRDSSLSDFMLPAPALKRRGRFSSLLSSAYVLSSSDFDSTAEDSKPESIFEISSWRTSSSTMPTSGSVSNGHSGFGAANKSHDNSLGNAHEFHPSTRGDSQLSATQDADMQAPGRRRKSVALVTLGADESLPAGKLYLQATLKSEKRPIESTPTEKRPRHDSPIECWTESAVERSVSTNFLAWRSDTPPDTSRSPTPSFCEDIDGLCSALEAQHLDKESESVCLDGPISAWPKPVPRAKSRPVYGTQWAPRLGKRHHVDEADAADESPLAEKRQKTQSKPVRKPRAPDELTNKLQETYCANYEAFLADKGGKSYSDDEKKAFEQIFMEAWDASSSTDTDHRSSEDTLTAAVPSIVLSSEESPQKLADQC